MRESDGVPVQFALFVDLRMRLAELEVIRLDGGPLIGDIDPERISCVEDKPGTVL